ncbi:hypothetical protein Clacol_008951 [Clathrus columnatus]|uniref:DHHA2 domain-containing protein n=1 Tax=Clathrus columnatus TaxID=1419009 RepID=A0AAV5AJ60_9AGAM|nr:hypothetical protein Clacol_008951 [Clathrus columnatus]
MKSLSEFLLTNRQHYLEALKVGRAQNWTVVVGNEAGDLDSAASSIAYSYLSSTLLQRPTIALLRTARSDFHLRAENDYAFSLTRLNSDHSDLLCIDDIPTELFPQILQSSFALVDHNHLDHIFTPAPNVVAIIDHHSDEGYHHDAQCRIIVVPVGSCTSLVTQHFLHHWQESTTEISPDVATLLLTGILIDTKGLKKNGKAVEIDHKAFQFLFPRSSWKAFSSVQEEDEKEKIEVVIQKLESLKNSVSHLSSKDLLRRDYKEYNIGETGSPTVVGIASVPLSIKSWLGMHPSPDFWDAMDEWMQERHLDVLGVLFSFHSKKNGKHKRQTLWVVKEGLDDLRKGVFKGLKEHKELELEVKILKHKYLTDMETTKTGKIITKAGATARVWNQLRTDSTRKVVAPLVRSIIESLQSRK